MKALGFTIHQKHSRSTRHDLMCQIAVPRAIFIRFYDPDFLNHDSIAPGANNIVNTTRNRAAIGQGDMVNRHIQSDSLNYRLLYVQLNLGNNSALMESTKTRSVDLRNENTECLCYDHYGHDRLDGVDYLKMFDSP